MNFDHHMTVTVELTLNEQEARWLHAAMQNPLAEDESKADAKIRQNLFDATDCDRFIDGGY